MMPRRCEQCGNTYGGEGKRFCSWACWNDWLAVRRAVAADTPLPPEQIIAEANAALTALQAVTTDERPGLTEGRGSVHTQNEERTAPS